MYAIVKKMSIFFLSFSLKDDRTNQTEEEIQVPYFCYNEHVVPGRGVVHI